MTINAMNGQRKMAIDNDLVKAHVTQGRLSAAGLHTVILRIPHDNVHVILEYL